MFFQGSTSTFKVETGVFRRLNTFLAIWIPSFSFFFFFLGGGEMCIKCFLLSWFLIEFVFLFSFEGVCLYKCFSAWFLIEFFQASLFFGL